MGHSRSKILAALSLAGFVASASTSSAATFTTIYDFRLKSGRPFLPSGPLTLGADGDFYGVTEEGGAVNGGTVFKLTPKGKVTLLHSFTGNPDGNTPSGTVVFDPAGNLYGTTSSGGSQGVGIVFKLAPDGTETVLHSFGGFNDAAVPFSGLIIDKSDNLYGVTPDGGSNDHGALFKINPTGVETIVFSFDAMHGQRPLGRLLLDTDGSLYGTTQMGGQFNEGTVFKLATDGEVRVLHNFASDGTDGEAPQSGLAFGPGGTLVGTTIYGGVGPSNGSGTVYSITGDGSEKILYDFQGNTGSHPSCELAVNAQGFIYGTTYSGGKANKGVVFQVAPSGEERVLRSFYGRNGSSPVSGLTFNLSGNLYGVTAGGGGRHFDGTVFEIAP